MERIKTKGLTNLFSRDESYPKEGLDTAFDYDDSYSVIHNHADSLGLNLTDRIL